MISVIVFLNLLFFFAVFAYSFVNKKDYWWSGYDYRGCKCICVRADRRGRYYVCNG